MRMELYNTDCGSVFNQKEMQIQRHFLSFVSEDKNQRKVFYKNPCQCLPYEKSSQFSLVCSIRTFLRTISYIYKMVGWHHRLNAHEFEQTQGDGERQKSLAYCSTWCYRVGHNWETEQQYYIYVCVYHILSICIIYIYIILYVYKIIYCYSLFFLAPPKPSFTNFYPD